MTEEYFKSLPLVEQLKKATKNSTYWYLQMAIQSCVEKGIPINCKLNGKKKDLYEEAKQKLLKLES